MLNKNFYLLKNMVASAHIVVIRLLVFYSFTTWNHNIKILPSVIDHLQILQHCAKKLQNVFFFVQIATQKNILESGNW